MIIIICKNRKSKHIHLITNGYKYYYTNITTQNTYLQYVDQHSYHSEIVICRTKLQNAFNVEFKGEISPFMCAFMCAITGLHNMKLLYVLMLHIPL